MCQEFIGEISARCFQLAIGVLLSRGPPIAARTEHRSRKFRNFLDWHYRTQGLPNYAQTMPKLKTILLVIGPVGAVLTMPTIEALSRFSGLMFLVLFLGFCVVTWVGLMMGRTGKMLRGQEPQVDPGSTQIAPLSSR